MPYIMRFPLLSKLTLVRDDPKIVPIPYIELDLDSLIEDRNAVIDILRRYENRDGVDYDVLLQISCWLLQCYKKIDSPMIANRILASLNVALTMANNKRKYKW